MPCPHRRADESNGDIQFCTTIDNAAQSSTFDSKLFLGYINDPPDLEAIMRTTPMPVPPHENCQNWVWAVIREAVRIGLMDESALTDLASVPSLGVGVS